MTFSSEKFQVCSPCRVSYDSNAEHSITSLNLVVNQVYRPYIQKLEHGEWGVCEDEQKKEFMSVFDKFSKELREAITSLSGVIELPKFDRRWENDARNIHTLKSTSAEMNEHFTDLFDMWIDRIERYLEETESSKNEEKDSGPKGELDHWRKRM